jgi:agmatinase
MTRHSGFLGFPDSLSDGETPRIVMFGAPYGTEYTGKDSSGYAMAATAIRAAVEDDASLIGNWDFDLNGPLFDDRPPCCVDIGDLPVRIGDNSQNRTLIEAKTREILRSGAVPLMIGGDDSTPIPFFAGFAASDPVWILQIDAHMDWRDELHGECFGYSSPMRRASEMAHVAGIVQVGMRGLGSARRQEVENARRYGASIVTAREIHAHGIDSAIRHIPQGARIVITVDCDGLDPSIMPGVVAPTPGGLTYGQVTGLIEAAAARGSIAGFDLVEFHTPSDIGNLTALTAARILVNAIGRIVRQA